MLKLAELTVTGRLSWVVFLERERRVGEAERDEEGELSERRPAVKRGEYCANMFGVLLLAVSNVGVGDVLCDEEG